VYHKHLIIRLVIHRFLHRVAIHHDQGKRHAGERAVGCGVNGRL
jgi:hypothetical protein